MTSPIQFYKRARKQYEMNRPFTYQFSLTKTENKSKKFIIILGRFIEVFKNYMKQDYKYEVQQSDNYWEQLEKYFSDLVEMKYIMQKIYQSKQVKIRLLFMLLLNNKKLFDFIYEVINKLPHLYTNPIEKLKGIDSELEPVSFFKDGQFKIITVTPNYIQQFKAFWEEQQIRKLLFKKDIKELMNQMVQRVQKTINQMLLIQQEKKRQVEENLRKQREKEEKQRRQIEQDKLTQKVKIQQQQVKIAKSTKDQIYPIKSSQMPLKSNPTQNPASIQDKKTEFTPFKSNQQLRTPQIPDTRELLEKKPKNMKNSQYLYQIRFKDQLQSYENNIHPYNFQFTMTQDKSKCTQCSKQLSRGLIIIGSDINLCNYSGKWFCNDCMAGERIQIPYKAKFQFDLKSYQVSKQAYQRIRFYYERPIIQFRYDDPVILENRKFYDFLVMKRQLHLMYDSICNSDFMNKTFGKKINYVLKRNLFSLKNLYDIYNGHEFAQIEKDFGILQRHFYKCQLCQSRKGRLCEICKNAPKIFAFELKQAYSCKHCLHIYHRRCLVGNKCPCQTSTLR